MINAKIDWNNPKNIHLSEERKEQFFEIINRHLDNMTKELKQVKIVPVTYGLRWTSVIEQDSISKYY